MKNRELKYLSYIYIALPIILFVIGFLKLYISIPITVIILIILYKIFRASINDDELVIDYKNIAIIFSITVVLCIFAGHGKFFYQSDDYVIRNAVFRDLVTKSWPVYYSNNSMALTYYIGQWIVPACIGKIFLFLGPEAAFMKANLALLLWNAFGVTICLLWLIKIIKPNSKKNWFLCIFAFLFFSGLDLVGMLIMQTYPIGIERQHIEWWGIFFQFSSMITQLFWVFNQCIVPWIVTLIVLEEKKVNNYVVLILFAVPYGPIPCVGLALLMAFKGIELLLNSIKDKKIKQFIKDVFSLQNILTIFTILPLYFLYYTANSSVQGGSGGSIIYLIDGLFTPTHIIIEVLFWFLEAGIYGLFLYKKHKNDILYYLIFISLLIIPFLGIGYEYDFSMRASIPCLVVIDVWIVELLIELTQKENFKNNTLTAVLFLIVFWIGTFTPLVEFYRGMNYAANHYYINESADQTITLDGKPKDMISNFVVEKPKESSVFYKYLAK